MVEVGCRGCPQKFGHLESIGETEILAAEISRMLTTLMKKYIRSLQLQLLTPTGEIKPSYRGEARPPEGRSGIISRVEHVERVEWLMKVCSE